MTLWLLLLALWLFESAVFVPPGGAWLRLRGDRTQVRFREGLWLSPPWPAPLTALLDGVPFEATAEHVHARGALTLFAATAGMEEERSHAFGDAHFEATGPRVTSRAGPLLRASSDVAARRIAGWLAVLDDAPAPERPERALALWRAVWAADDTAERVRRLARATLPHRVLATVSVLAVAVGLPALAGVAEVGLDAAWELAWPGLLGLHALAWLALGLAELQLAAPGRTQRLFRSLAFPPTLWRASVELASAALGDRDPLGVAFVLVRRDALLPLARRAVAECTWPAFERGGREPPDDAPARRAALAARRELLLTRCAEAGLHEAELMGPPKRRDPHTASYCPVCQSEFVVDDWVCPECRIETRPFPATAGERVDSVNNTG